MRLAQFVVETFNKVFDLNLKFLRHLQNFVSLVSGTFDKVTSWTYSQLGSQALCPKRGGARNLRRAKVDDIDKLMFQWQGYPIERASAWDLCLEL